MATVGDPVQLKAQWKAACEGKDADRLWDILQQASAQSASFVEALASSDTSAGFQVACRKGHLGLMHELLARAGDLGIDVKAADEDGPEAAFRWACREGHSDIVCVLLGLTGAREVDVHAADERGPEAGFRWACRGGHTDIVLELLGLT